MKPLKSKQLLVRSELPNFWTVTNFCNQFHLLAVPTGPRLPDQGGRDLEASSESDLSVSRRDRHPVLRRSRFQMAVRTDLAAFSLRRRMGEHAEDGVRYLRTWHPAAIRTVSSEGAPAGKRHGFRCDARSGGRMARSRISGRGGLDRRARAISGRGTAGSLENRRKSLRGYSRRA